jgi:hypothetical protein
MFWELDQALAEIGEFPNSEWETVKLADSEAPSFVRNRLSAAPGR